MKINLYKRIEVLVISILFFLLALFLVWDFLSDLRNSVLNFHIYLEFFLGFMSGLASLFFVKSYLKKVNQLKIINNTLQKSEEEALYWQKETKQLAQGISDAMYRQFERWDLTQAEQEVALEIIKGLSFKEIALKRFTQEKTVRTQAISIYEKSNLQGRHELAGYFLESLFP